MIYTFNNQKITLLKRRANLLARRVKENPTFSWDRAELSALLYAIRIIYKHFNMVDPDDTEKLWNEVSNNARR